MTNRIVACAERYKERIEAVKSKGVDLQLIPSDESLAKLDETMALTFDDHFQYQQLQAQAHASGTLSTDEALVIYQALGESMSTENGGWRSHVTLSMKVAITQVMGEILSARLGR